MSTTTYDALLNRFLTSGGKGGSARELVLKCVCEHAPISLNHIVLKTGLSAGNCRTILGVLAQAGILAQTRSVQWVLIIAPTRSVLAVVTCPESEEATTIRPPVALVAAMKDWLAEKGMDMQNAYLEMEVEKKPSLAKEPRPDLETLARAVVTAFDSGKDIAASVAQLRSFMEVSA